MNISIVITNNRKVLLSIFSFLYNVQPIDTLKKIAITSIIRICECGLKFFKIEGCSQVKCSCGRVYCYDCNLPYHVCDCMDNGVDIFSDYERMIMAKHDAEILINEK
jgi:hypothetical protein